MLPSKLVSVCMNQYHLRTGEQFRLPRRIDRVYLLELWGQLSSLMRHVAMMRKKQGTLRQIYNALPYYFRSLYEKTVLRKRCKTTWDSITIECLDSYNQWSRETAPNIPGTGASVFELGDYGRHQFDLFCVYATFQVVLDEDVRSLMERIVYIWNRWMNDKQRGEVLSEHPDFLDSLMAR